MSLPSLNFLDTLRRDNRQFAVIGLGRFGRAVCATLHKLGYDVMGTDIDERLVAQVITDKIASTAIQLDSTKPIALKEAGIFEFDTVIVAIGNFIEESIITTLNVKEFGVNCVVAKASTEIHGKLLKRVGADIVVFPEYEAGCDLAYTLTKPAILERFDLDEENSIVEIRIPEEFDNKSLAELQIRARFGLNVIAIGDGDKYKINPSPLDRLHKNCAMVVMGSNRDIQRLPI
ncbi:potassium channel family protein [Gloeothece citriformis]|uniref:potassium channel family protein n=1 Tax=Gloeothece citriformis TaxID=2546356 RepID=UPI001EF0A1F1|nr:TrkA family potassium uptake protein [Gloeothece citriformis]